MSDVVPSFLLFRRLSSNEYSYSEFASLNFNTSIGRFLIRRLMLSPMLISLLFFGLMGSVSAFHSSVSLPYRRHSLSMNFFDNLKVIFSREGQQNIKAYNEREKEEMLAAQKEILERRRDPKKMREYEETKEQQRKKLAEERAMFRFQQKSEGDPIEDWKKLREEGKIKMSKELERDQSSSRLGSEGLIGVRVDERMPYIDQGYVDEDADVMGKLMGMFKKKK